MVAHSLIVAPGRERQADFCEFEVSLVYRASLKSFSEVLFLLDRSLQSLLIIVLNIDVILWNLYAGNITYSVGDHLPGKNKALV